MSQNHQSRTGGREQNTDGESSFILAAMDLEGVSVGRVGALLECRSSEYDDQARIDNESVLGLAREHGLRVFRSSADFEVGELRTFLYDPERGDPPTSRAERKRNKKRGDA